MKSSADRAKTIDSDYSRPEAGAVPAEWQEWKKRKRERQTEWKEKKMAKKQKMEDKAKAEIEEKMKMKEEEEKRTEKEGRKWTLSVAVAGSIIGKTGGMGRVKLTKTLRHSIVHFEGQLALMISNKQINRQTATIKFE